MSGVLLELDDSEAHKLKIPVLETYDYDSLDSDTFRLKTENILSHFPLVKGQKRFRQMLNASPSEESSYFHLKFIKKKSVGHLCVCMIDLIIGLLQWRSIIRSMYLRKVFSILFLNR